VQHLTNKRNVFDVSHERCSSEDRTLAQRVLASQTKCTAE